jgi:hypothetical protein
VDLEVACNLLRDKVRVTVYEGVGNVMFFRKVEGKREPFIFSIIVGANKVCANGIYFNPVHVQDSSSSSSLARTEGRSVVVNAIREWGAIGGGGFGGGGAGGGGFLEAFGHSMENHGSEGVDGSRDSLLRGGGVGEFES